MPGISIVALKLAGSPRRSGWWAAVFFQAIAALALAAPARGQILMSVTPIRVEHAIAPGQAKTDVITVENVADKGLRARVVVSDWYLDRDGTPVFVKRGAITRFSMSDWIEVNPTELTLRPGETRTIRYTFRIPPDIAEGGH